MACCKVAALAMTFVQEESKVNDTLRQKGIPYSLRELHLDPSLYPNCAAQLLELFKSSFSQEMRAVLGRALFARKPDPTQTRDAVDFLISILKPSGQQEHPLSSLVLNE